MKDTKQVLPYYFFEYLYREAMEAVAVKQIELDRTPLSISDGIYMRSLLSEKLGKGLPKNGSVYMAHLDEIIADHFGEECKVFASTNHKEDVFYNNVKTSFLETTGFETLSSVEPVQKGNIPLSPYAPVFSNRYHFVSNGGKLLYLPTESIGKQLNGELLDPLALQNGFRYSVYNKPYNYDIDQATNDKESLVGKLSVMDDTTRLSSLRPHMTNENYQNVRAWVHKITSAPGGYDNIMSAKAIERSVAILTYMQKEGIEYEVSKDRYEGQIKATVLGTGISVRLMDSKANENYIGRVYDNGAAIYYITDKREPNSPKTLPYEGQTPEESVDLLRFALGKNVKGHKGTDVGMSKVYGSGNTRLNSAYHTSNGFTAAYKPLEAGSLVYIHTSTKNRSARDTYFRDDVVAKEYLENAVRDSRANLSEILNVDDIIEKFKQNQDNLDLYSYPFSSDPAISAIQESYWSVLAGEQTDLLKPGVELDLFEERIGMIGELGGDIAESSMVRSHLDDLIYDGTPEEKIRSHFDDHLTHIIGTFEQEDIEGLRFNPVGVSQYMDSAYSMYRNNDDIVSALKVLDMDVKELRGDDFYNKTIKDKLISFNVVESIKMKSLDNPFVKSMYSEILSSLRESACEVNEDDILIDDNGIVKYKAIKMSAKNANAKSARKEIEGTIGQLFIPEENGTVKTRFNGSDNYMFVPGYDAIIRAQSPGETFKTVEERTVLKGYEQLMRERIRYNIRNDVYSNRDGIGSTTSLNRVYRRLYDERFDLDFMDKSTEHGLSDDWKNALLSTLAGRVKYSNEIKEGSTINAFYKFEKEQERNKEILEGYINVSNPSFVREASEFSPIVLTGGRNMGVLSKEGDGYFDQMATGGATNQGVVRYLSESCKVNPDGTMIKGQDGDGCSIMKHPDARYMKFDPFNRQQMSFSNVLQTIAITEPVGSAFISLNGRNQDDAIVISQDMAEEYRVPDSSGKLRPLVIGDKFSDFHGNKGVIGLVVNRDMSEIEAKELGIAYEVELFKTNPELDYVTSYASFASRFNGGTAREAMEDTQDLVLPDGEVIKGGIGKLKYMVTDMTVDAKTKIYDDESMAAGKGRKSSGQLAWALNSKDCKHIMTEFYHTNNTTISNARELMITTGLDLDEIGDIRVGYKPHEGEKRNVFEIPELENNEKGVLQTRKMVQEFNHVVDSSGGFLKIPFPLDYPAKDKAGKILKLEQTEEGSYLLPVLSSYLRTGQAFEDGTSMVHDYTNQYLNIYEESIKYLDAQAKLSDTTISLDSKDKMKFKTIVEAGHSRAQMSFNQITGDIADKRFSGKYNVFRDGIMTNKLSNSATAVWSSDSNLDVDSIAIGPIMAESLGVKNEDHVLVWRDPMLRDGGVRYMKVQIKDDLTGAAINPISARCFDGDFDGDSVAIVKLNTKEAHNEAMNKLTFQANLLDYGVKHEDGTYSLNFEDGLDMQVAHHYNPELAKEWEMFGERVNKTEADYAEGKIDAKTVWAVRNGTTKSISNHARQAFKESTGKAVIQFDTVENHIKSVEDACVTTGAKGGMKGLKEYMRYLGVEEHGEIDSAVIDYTSLEDKKVTLAGRQDYENTQYATEIRSFGTGIAGMYSQRGFSTLRNYCPKAILELTYPVTQATVDAKHDPVRASKIYDNLMSTTRELWRGKHIYEDENGWQSHDDQATRSQWVDKFCDFYESSEGLNVKINRDYVEEVSRILSDNEGNMLNMESDKVKAVLTAPMDKMAYGGSFEVLNDLAITERNVFEGKHNKYFAPNSIKTNIKIRENQDDSLIVKGIMKDDIMGKRKVKTPKIAVTNSVAAKAVSFEPKKNSSVAYTYSSDKISAMAKSFDDGMEM